MEELNALKQWFLEEKRSFPWRDNPTPYRVWVSEVMLQQTRASVVVGYFERWMQKFPTLEKLAEAPFDEVIKAWEGLGYYSRARFLHEGAKRVMREFSGSLPAEREVLEQIKGFGPYTAGAVLSFAFHKRAAAVDGNVIRVIARLFGRTEDVSQKRVFQGIVEEILPQEEPWVVMEALIELGAQVCLKRPNCAICPLKTSCIAFGRGDASLLPVNGRRATITRLYRKVAVIFYEEEVLVRQEEVGKVMGGLYEFPYTEAEWPFDLPMEHERDLPMVKQSFTRFVATLSPAIYRARERRGVAGYRWLPWEQVNRLPFSSGHRKIATMVRE